MPSPLRSPKTLADWLDLGYVERPRFFRRLWKLAVIGALLVALAGVAWALLPGNRTALQAGPVSTAHALFNNDCGQCHIGSYQTLVRFVTQDASLRAVPDAACQKCHPGPAHHADKAGPEGACALCHREHRGHELLARVNDEHCLACHRNLANTVQSRGTVAYQNVPSFDQHPAFAPRWPNSPNDPGTLRFSHAAHLQPEGVLTLDVKQRALQWDKPEESEKAKKTLHCGDCHQPDDAGRYMKPINYEQHCKECHPLSVQVVSDLGSATARQARKEFSAVPVPHREPGVVRAALRDRLTQFIAARDHAEFLGAAGEAELPRPIPGGPQRPQSVTEKQFQWVNEQLPKVEGPLFNRPGGCAYCHQEQGRSDGLPAYAPTAVNRRAFAGLGDSPRWFPHSHFSHERHRLLDCTVCHAGARDSKDEPGKPRAVLMPTIEVCRQCHTDRSGASARTDCVECHIYHPAEERRKFVGTLTIDPITGKLQENASHAPD